MMALADEDRHGYGIMLEFERNTEERDMNARRFSTWLQRKPSWLALLLGAAAILALAWFRGKQRERNARTRLVWESRKAPEVQPLVLNR